ncbi:hypothetical protein T492DRAFT_1094354 [Pavlovales sp. CCMP2436]|nr:hypothetical protein T492DRAFT_1094354 [Pavlovales sp. CCMP2436]
MAPMRRPLVVLLAALVSHDGLAATWPAVAVRAAARASCALRATAGARSTEGRGRACVRMAAAKAKKAGKGDGKGGKKAGGFSQTAAPEAMGAEGAVGAVGVEGAESVEGAVSAEGVEGVEIAVGVDIAEGARGAEGVESLVVPTPAAVAIGEVRGVVSSPELAAAQQLTRSQMAVISFFGNDPFLRIPPEEWSLLRLPRVSTNEAILAAVRKAVADGSLDSFVRANRDFLVKRWQVWVMAEAMRQKAAGNTAGEQAMRQALGQIILSNRAFDAPLANAVAAREQALNEAFESSAQSEAAKPTIVDLAGKSSLEHLGFWVVIQSAKEAWLERLNELDASDVSLREAMVRKVGQMDQFLEAIELTPEIQPEPVPALLVALGKNEISEDAIGERLAFQLGSILGCLECLRYQAYAALALRISMLMDAVAGSEPKPLSVGGPVGLASAIEDGLRGERRMSSLVKYEIEQAKMEGRDSKVKLSNLLAEPTANPK